MNVGLNLLLEFLVISGLIVISYLCGFQETHNLLHNEDIGSVIMTFGIFWLVASVFRLHKMSHGIVSACVAFGIMIFGYVLFKFGLGYALVTAGCYSFFMIPIVGLISNSAVGVMVIIAISSLLIGYPIRHVTKPTNLRPDIYQPLTDPNAEWELQLINYGQECTATKVVQTTRVVACFTGTEYQAYSKAYDLMEKKHYFANLVSLAPTYISPEYTPSRRRRQYIGLSTDQLDHGGYSQDDRPAWLFHPFWKFTCDRSPLAN